MKKVQMNIEIVNRVSNTVPVGTGGADAVAQQRMSSMEIAEVAGRQHKDVMRAIRGMERAWERVNGRSFALVDYTDAKGERRPCYELTLLECLYIATKFNDEARARLVLRWQELEQRRTRRLIAASERRATGPVRQLIARTTHGRVREGVDDYTLYIRIPSKALVAALGVSKEEFFEAEFGKLMELI